MYFKSKQSENLVKLKKQKEIARFSCENNDSFAKVWIEVSRKTAIPNDQIHFRLELKEIDEYGHTENEIVFYYYEEESNAEYAKRIEDLERQDAQEFVQSLMKYVSLCGSKAELKEMIDRLSKRFYPADWQRKWIDSFFGDKSTEELVNEAREQGRKEGRIEERNALRAKLQ